LSGEAFLHAERKNEQEIPKELWPFHPGRFKEVVDEQTGLILGWVYNRGVKKIPPAHEVAFFRLFQPLSRPDFGLA
jgi:hypothetical protein